MKRRLLLGLSIILVASGIFLLVRVVYNFRTVGKGGLQITSNVRGKAFLNGKLIGELPIRKTTQDETLPTGNYEIRVEPEDTTLTAYTARVDINDGVLTAIDKTFLPGSLGSASILTLENATIQKPQIEITTIPDGALITIDSVAVGTSPYKSDSISASEHEVEIQKEGFAKKTIRVRTVERHVLVVSASLGTGDIGTVKIASPTPTIELSITPSPVVTKGSVTILQTPNGFLRVRSGAGTSFGEVARVKTGETYDIIEEQNGWYQIEADGKTGWVTSQYVKKN